MLIHDAQTVGIPREIGAVRKSSDRSLGGRLLERLGNGQRVVEAPGSLDA